MVDGGSDESDMSRNDSIMDMARQGLNQVDTKKIQGSISKIPNRIRRKIRESESSSLLTMFPVLAVSISLMFTLFMLPHSGILDCRDGFDNEDLCNEEPALNVNGDLEVYLPTDDDPYSV